MSLIYSHGRMGVHFIPMRIASACAPCMQACTSLPTCASSAGLPQSIAAYAAHSNGASYVASVSYLLWSMCMRSASDGRAHTASRSRGTFREVHLNATRCMKALRIAHRMLWWVSRAVPSCGMSQDTAGARHRAPLHLTAPVATSQWSSGARYSCVQALVSNDFEVLW